MSFCQICYEEVDKSFYDCPCQIILCIGCFLEWAQAQISAQILSETVNWKCPNQSEEGKCRSDYSIGDLVDMLSMNLKASNTNNNEKQIIYELINKLNDAALKHYLVQANDIRKCPNPSCSYSGIAVFDCCDEFLCEKCDTRWRDPLQKQSRARISKYIYNEVSEWIQNFFSDTRKLWLTEPCPQCGMIIQKDGGCQKVSCIKCRYDFCWFCLRSYKNYRHNEGEMPFCPTRVFALYGVQILAVILPLIAKIIVLFFSIRAFWSFLYYLLAFLLVKVVFIICVIIIEDYRTNPKVFYAVPVVFGVICSSLFFEFPSAALMIFFIEVTLAIYSILTVSFVIATKNIAFKLYDKLKPHFYSLYNKVVAPIHTFQDRVISPVITRFKNFTATFQPQQPKTKEDTFNKNHKSKLQKRKPKRHNN